MSSSRRGVISESLAAARTVRPWLQAGSLGIPESKVWEALRGLSAEPVQGGRHRRPEAELDPQS